MTAPFFKDLGPFTEAATEVKTMLKLQNGNVLVVYNTCIHMLDADLRLIWVVGGDEAGFADGPAAQARFDHLTDLALLPDGRVLVADSYNASIRLLSADLQHVSTVAGDGTMGHRDGAAAQAQFRRPHALALLPNRRVLVTDEVGNCIRLLDANLEMVSTVAGEGSRDHQDGPAMQARFLLPRDLALLPDGRVLVTDGQNSRIRAISADLSTVSTVAEGLFTRPCQIVVANNLVLVVDQSNPGAWIFDVANGTKRQAFGENARSRIMCLSSMFQMRAGLSERDSHVLRTCVLVAMNHRTGPRIVTFAYGDWIAVENLLRHGEIEGLNPDIEKTIFGNFFKLTGVGQGRGLLW